MRSLQLLVEEKNFTIKDYEVHQLFGFRMKKQIELYRNLNSHNNFRVKRWILP